MGVSWVWRQIPVRSPTIQREILGMEEIWRCSSACCWFIGLLMVDLPTSRLHDRIPAAEFSLLISRSLIPL
jgi:hypothetical protein